MLAPYTSLEGSAKQLPLGITTSPAIETLCASYLGTFKPYSPYLVALEKAICKDPCPEVYQKY